MPYKRKVLKSYKEYTRFMPKAGFQFSVTGWASRVATNQFVEKLNCSRTD